MKRILTAKSIAIGYEFFMSKTRATDSVFDGEQACL